MHAMAMQDLKTSGTEGYAILLRSFAPAYSELRYDLIVLKDPYVATFLGLKLSISA